MSMTGRCLCDAVRFRAEDVETGFHSCHCAMCRRWGGGPAMAASAGSVKFDGEEHIGRYASSDWAERGFCRNCGTHLFYRLVDQDHYVLWTGAFDDADAFTLAGEIFVDEKPEGYAFAGDHPRMTGEETIALWRKEHDA